jgi:ERCC4-related helicase
MSFKYQFPAFIDLYVKDRISEADAHRQSETAKAILQRLSDQPGLILADEVGMGKTFVALAVATAIYLRDKKPVVIMIPVNLKSKWPADFRLFKEACITDKPLSETLRCGVAERPEEFFKLLGEPVDKRCAVIFMTHGALTRNMSDGWIKLAIIQKALYRRRDTADLYKSLSRYAGSLVEMQYMENRNKTCDIWTLLLNASPTDWKKILIKYGFVTESFDEPVPSLFTAELDRLGAAELDSLYWQLREEIPKRESDNIKNRLREVRKILSDEARLIWSRCLSNIKLNLPLLIFDEAHHLKNKETQLVTKLFSDPATEEDAGILTGQFDRMMFLTATPFQLGHHELCHVLERFNTINWSGLGKPSGTSKMYMEDLNLLLHKLDDSQIAARKLDNSWGKLIPHDLLVNGVQHTNIYDWWQVIHGPDVLISAAAQRVIDDYRSAKEKLGLVEPILKRHVIRHLKPRSFGEPFYGISRRHHLPGNLILTDQSPLHPLVKGLDIKRESMLPFLLAARLTTLHQNKRPVFAEGLASSFEAFRFTREERLKKVQAQVTDEDDDQEKEMPEQLTDKVSLWYLQQLNEVLDNSFYSGGNHPKIKPTVDKAIELWSQGEKVLIFCHYIATGKALRKYISQAMKAYIQLQGAEKLQCKPEEVFDHLEKIADRITDKDSRLYKACFRILNTLINEYPDLEAHRSDIIDAILRYMRTPSFLVRFASGYNLEDSEKWITQSFATADNSGVTLLDTIRGFVHFLDKRKENREEYISDLKSIQPGGIRVKDIPAHAHEEEFHDEKDNTVMANVRLCYGATKQETRQKLMKTFNTPFFPDILIASSVMAEGVDLHLSCRHIIHHDLCWNPSTLEQRTGRVDRIGAKNEKCGKPIMIYMPYISETQDEKMYRVVTERERWFNIIMGEKYKVDAFNTDKYSQRIPLPEELSNELSFNLAI